MSMPDQLQRSAGNRAIAALLGRETTLGADTRDDRCLTMLGRHPGLAASLTSDQYVALASGRVTRLVLPLHQIMPPGVVSLTREEVLTRLVPGLAGAAGPSSGAAGAVAQIAALETTRVFVADKLRLPATVLVDGDDLRVVVAGQQVPTDESGLVTVAGLDRISIATIQTIATQQAAAAEQLVDLRMIEAKIGTVTDQVLPELSKAISDPADIAYDDVAALSHACHQLSAYASTVAARLHPANADQRPTLDEHLAALQRATASAAEAVTVVRRFAEAHPVDDTPGETYEQVERQYAEAAEVSPKGILAAGNWLATKGFHLAGEAVTFGGMGRSAANAGAYRSGRISWNAYRENEWWNLGISAVAAIVSTLTGGLAGRAAGSMLGAGLTLQGTAIIGGAVGGGVAGATAAMAGDAGAEVAAAVTDDRYVSAFQRATVVGPLGWLESGLGGAILGGLLGRLFGGRRGTVPAAAAADDVATTPPTMTVEGTAGPVALVEGKPVNPTSYGRMFHGNDLTPQQVRSAGGFRAAGSNWDLVRHTEELWRTEGGVNDSAFRGGTPLLRNAAEWGEWVYEIEGMPSWDTNQLLQGRVRVAGVGEFRGNLMHGEVEHSLPGEVPLQAIKRFGRVVDVGKGRGVREWFSWDTLE